MNARSRAWSATLILLAALLSTNLIQSRPVQANPGMDVDINFFYGALAPYGNWVDHDMYGRVWYPHGVSVDWRPYTDGHWEYTYDYGWVWVSDWEWGWAPFHYGRWAWDDWYGWIWIPGRVWAPAWVFWRYGGGYAAWAPMPPNALWRHRWGLMPRYFDYDRDLRRDWWVSVPERYLHHRRINRYLIEPHDNDRYLKRMDNFVNIDERGDVIVNHGVPVKQIEKSSGESVRPVRLREVERIEDRKRDKRRDELTVFRPNVRPPDDEEVRREEQLAERLSRQNAEQQRVRPDESHERPAQPAPRQRGSGDIGIFPQPELPVRGGTKGGMHTFPEPTVPGNNLRQEFPEQGREPPVNRGSEQVTPDNGNLREWRRKTEERHQQQLEMQREQAERANEEAIRQQRQDREYQQRQMELQQQQQLELQRRQVEQTQRANEQVILQRQQQQQERVRQMELQRQQMEIQRQQMEQVERANREAMRQQQLLEQRQQEIQRQQQMQIQLEQGMRQQQMEMQRQQSEQMQRGQQQGRPQEMQRGNNPRSSGR